jgi:hypothetical protein
MGFCKIRDYKVKTTLHLNDGHGSGQTRDQIKICEAIGVEIALKR